MPILSEWRDDHTTLHVRFEGRWSWEELLEANAHHTEQMNDISHPVYLLLDFTHNSGLPSGNVVGITGRMARQFPEHLVAQIVISNSMLINTFTSIYRTVNRASTFSVHVVKSLEEGLTLLDKLKSETVKQDGFLVENG